MKVADVMTKDVVTVGREMPLREVAVLLADAADLGAAGRGRRPRRWRRLRG